MVFKPFLPNIFYLKNKLQQRDNTFILCWFGKNTKDDQRYWDGLKVISLPLSTKFYIHTCYSFGQFHQRLKLAVKTHLNYAKTFSSSQKFKRAVFPQNVLFGTLSMCMLTKTFFLISSLFSLLFQMSGQNWIIYHMVGQAIEISLIKDIQSTKVILILYD